MLLRKNPWASSGTRARILSGIQSASGKKHRSDSAKKRWADPKLRKKQSLKMKGNTHNLRLGELQRVFTLHYKHFGLVMRRVRENDVDTDMRNDMLGFLWFVSQIGPIPKMKGRLSVGRNDHTKGYVDGNYAWQDLSENDRESAFRVRPHLYITKDALARRGRAVAASWNDPAVRRSRVEGVHAKRKQIARKLRKRWKDPAWRAKVIAAQNAGRLKRK